MNPQANPGTWDAIETRKYVWDGFNIAAEIIIDHVTPATNISFYTWGIDLSGSLQGAGGVGGLLSDTRLSSTETNSYYALGDANGNVTEYVDENGTVEAHYEYSATGEETYKSGSMKDDFTHRFSTKPYDPETGLVAYELRYLKPDLTFLSRDPIEERGGNNLYGFVDNDAVNKVDPLGLKETNWKRIGFIVHGHVPHCVEWRDVGGGTRANHQKTYCSRCIEMAPSVPQNLCSTFAGDAVNALGLGSGRYSTAFTAIY